MVHGLSALKEKINTNHSNTNIFLIRGGSAPSSMIMLPRLGKRDIFPKEVVNKQRSEGALGVS